MTRLSVNINKIATIRNARGGNIPDVLKAAIDCEEFGAHGITVHPRPDQRHIRNDDVYKIRNAIKCEFNIEGYPSKEFIKMILDVKPDQVTLVPDPPEALTSNAGWDTKRNQSFLQDVISTFRNASIRTSLFTDTEFTNIEYAKLTGTDRIELYTEPYASGYENNRKTAIDPFIKAAALAKKIGLGINAGHDLNLKNLNYFCKNIRGLDEVSIGHALISDALYLGLKKTIKLYLKEINITG